MSVCQCCLGALVMHAWWGHDLVAVVLVLVVLVVAAQCPETMMVDTCNPVDL